MTRAAGTAEVTLRFNIAVRPFPQGVLAGAVSPRQIAEKAKAQPKEAAAFFENGTVAHWYKENGWDYPVKGPATSGLAAIQQYFEAHGLASAPKVGINQDQVVLMGAPGEAFATARDSHPGKARRFMRWRRAISRGWRSKRRRRAGRLAPSTCVVTVPDSPGETLHAKLVIRERQPAASPCPCLVQVGGSTRQGVTANVPARCCGGAWWVGTQPARRLADRSPFRPGLIRPERPDRPATAGDARGRLARSRPSRDDDDRDDRTGFHAAPQAEGQSARPPACRRCFCFLRGRGIFVHDIFVKGRAKRHGADRRAAIEEKLDINPWVALRMQDSAHPYPSRD